MTTRSAFRLLFAVLSMVFGAVAAVDAAQRTFVSTSGLDANACTLTAPCRGFAKAITVTDLGGEIIVLDSGGYGVVTISQNVKIVSPAGVYAGISVFGGTDGVTVTAPAGNVVLRGLTINGQGGNNGILVQAGEVHVENTVISNMAQAGIRVEGGTSVRISGAVLRSNVDGLRVLPTAGAVTVLVRDSEVSNNGQIGMRISPTGAGSSALVTVERTSVTKHSGYGIYSGPAGGGTATIVVTQSVLSENTLAGVASAGSGATIWVRESAVTRNGTGLWQGGSGVLNACGANLLVANTTATSGTINTSSCLDVASGTGTVTSIATGAGLSGGPITTTGTITADTAYLQRRVSGTCASGSSIRTINNDGTVVCEADDAGTGTVTSVGTGTGLTGGPITGAGTVSIAAGGVGNAQLADGSVSVAKLDTASTDARYFKRGGNSFGTGAVLGTTDNQTLELWANNTASLRLQPTAADPANNFNTATPNVIGGWNINAAYVGVIGATVGGGGGDVAGALRFNLVTDHYGTVGGGAGNTAGDALGTTRDRRYATVGGGFNNTASGGFSTVSGGANNTASGEVSTVGGGDENTTSGYYSTIGGGEVNHASGQHSTVGGGFVNTASGDYSTVAGGRVNIASGESSIAGGDLSEARGNHSIALGRRAKAYNGVNIGHGTIVLADGNDFDFNIGTDNRFAVRATGGIYLALGIDGTGAATWVCQASDGNAWACASDRNLKHGLVELDGRAVLAKLTAMPIYQWQPKGQNAHVKHYGPMAQDFHAAFGLGDDDKLIGMQDADGVALAAIQGLNTKLEERLAEMSARMQAQDLENAELRDRVARVESLRGELVALKAALVEALAANALLAWR